MEKDLKDKVNKIAQNSKIPELQRHLSKMSAKALMPLVAFLMGMPPKMRQKILPLLMGSLLIKVCDNMDEAFAMPDLIKEKMSTFEKEINRLE